MLADVNRTLIGVRCGVEHVLKPHPHMDSALCATMPLLDEGFVGMQCFEIVVIWMLSHIRDKHRPDAKLCGSLGAAMHVTPHIYNGGCPRQKCFGITKIRCDL